MTNDGEPVKEWAALAMIREELERYEPLTSVISREGVLVMYGPEPTHDAEALVEAIRRLARAVGFVDRAVTPGADGLSLGRSARDSLG
jgi:hypothetical protein